MRGAPRAYRARRPPTVLYKFLVWEEHAAQFGVEFSECAGANILSVGQTSTKATHDLKLVTVQLPAGYVSNTQAARPQRFVNERVQLTEAGESDLARGKRKNQIVWGFRYRCGGIDNYVCVSDTAPSASTAPAARAGASAEHLQPARPSLPRRRSTRTARDGYESGMGGHALVTQ